MRHRSARHGATEAKFRIDPNDIYFRIDVLDDHGNHANTNAIFTEDIFLINAV